MSPTQLEHAPTFTDPLPAQDTIERLKRLCRQHDCVSDLVFRKRYSLGVARKYSESPRVAQLTNELTQAELRHAEIEKEIYNVARLLVAEADAEMETI